ncbi:hypothetical protein D9756_008949 [Leucocoprinus leucothites]|uniref:F-box domain-containing protein n=1 Tax=Leucocoprinus leucothites TaxID=201217 RepID=A0A8H5FTW7_9AGAR|nr:hypothetical protein D9756_008949 [Leucoagaricus leucothites]
MAHRIHERLPNEIFCDILLQAARTADAHDARQASSRRQSAPDLRESIKFSSVCQGWRQIVTSDRNFWLKTSFKNFSYPSSEDALACMKAVLQRTYQGFHRISLDFRSLKGADNAEVVIETALAILLEVSPELSSSRWKELCLLAADGEHIDNISDYFLLTASMDARAKLSAITTLQVSLTLDTRPHNHPSTTPHKPFQTSSLALPWFSTKHFHRLTCLYLTNVRALVFQSNILQCLLSSKQMFELWLHCWTCKIDNPVFFTDYDSNTDSQTLPFHIVTNSPMNFLNSSLRYATALTIKFSMPVPRHDIAINLPNSPNVSNVARLFLQNDFSGIRTLRLNNVTPRIWLTFLALLKPLPSLLLANDQFLPPLSSLPWEFIDIHFAPFQSWAQVISPFSSQSVLSPSEDEREGIASTSVSMYPPILSAEEDPPSIKWIKDGLGLPFDVEAELKKAESIEDLEGLMVQCSAIYTPRLPRLKSISFHDSKGGCWRLDLNSNDGNTT